jgi:uncharacterized membrane protein
MVVRFDMTHWHAVSFQPSANYDPSMVQPDFREWLNILVRIAHFIAGIMWVGTSFYFVWLDSAFTPPAVAEKGVEGEAYMVHGGFFYRVEKRRFGAGAMPRNLHWFKWEATLTWITGFILLWVVYYTTDGAFLTDPAVRLLAPALATAIGLGVVFGGWLVYDGYYRLPLSRSKWGSGVILALLACLVYFLTHTFSGRGAFIELGAMFGTIMVLNVWVHILPNQRAIIKAADEGREPDYELGLKAKRRSMHNSYLTIPVLFMMISNHFSSLYDHKYSWVLLILITLTGALARHVMISAGRWPLIPAAAAIGVMVYMTGLPPEIKIDAAGPKVAWAQANEIIHNRCMMCHAKRTSDEVFHSPPSGIAFDSPEIVKAMAPLILQRAVFQRTMPFGNKSGMTDEEREILGRWIVQGAEIH